MAPLACSPLSSRPPGQSAHHSCCSSLGPPPNSLARPILSTHRIWLFRITPASLLLVFALPALRCHAYRTFNAFPRLIRLVHPLVGLLCLPYLFVSPAIWSHFHSSVCLAYLVCCLICSHQYLPRPATLLAASLCLPPSPLYVSLVVDFCHMLRRPYVPFVVCYPCKYSLSWQSYRIHYNIVPTWSGYA